MRCELGDVDSVWTGFNENASGVFFGLHASHDQYDLALAIMEGVACLLKKNLDYMKGPESLSAKSYPLAEAPNPRSGPKSSPTSQGR